MVVLDAVGNAESSGDTVCTFAGSVSEKSLPN